MDSIVPLFTGHGVEVHLLNLYQHSSDQQVGPMVRLKWGSFGFLLSTDGFSCAFHSDLLTLLCEDVSVCPERHACSSGGREGG